MKILDTGVGGQLGHDVINELYKRGHEGVGSDIAPQYSGIADGSAVTTAPYFPMDITDKDSVQAVLNQVKPDVVVHCAAWTAVDLAEEEENIAKVRAINATGTQNIADVCKALDCKMIYISTDYVFDGQGETPWQPDCKDYKPLNVYGQTKLEGELAVAETLEKYSILISSLEEIASVCDCTEGLENAFKKAALFPQDIVSSLTSARYTSARIRRIALQNLLKIPEKLIRESLQIPLYLRILAAKKPRTDVLSALSESPLPLLIRAHDEDALLDTAKACFERDLFAEKVYALLYDVKSNKSIFE